MTAAQVLPSLGELFEHAGQIQAERGRCIGNYEGYDGSLCVLGAVAVAVGEPPEVWPFLDEGPQDDVTRLLTSAARRLAVVMGVAGADEATVIPVDKLAVRVGEFHDQLTDEQLAEVLAVCAAGGEAR